MRILALLVFAARLFADDQFLKWMDRIAQEQLSQREAAVVKIQTVDAAQARQQR